MQLKKLRTFYKNTDYKLIFRVVCSVCGRYLIVKNKEKIQYDIKILIENKSLLVRQNLSDYNYVKPFVYDNNDLNDLVLDKCGIDNSTNKVNFKKIRFILNDRCHANLF